MPWNQQSVGDMREEFVILAKQKKVCFKDLCKRYSISRKTGYKWLKRYGEQGRRGLEDLSKTPKVQPKKTSKAIEIEVVKLRDAHPTWGGRKIRHVLIRKGIEAPPAASTITGILHRNGKVNAELSEQNGAWQRFEHAEPNRLWQMDFKGHFAMEDKNRCHPLTIVDDHSRFAIAIKAFLNEQSQTVKMALEETFRQYGLPDRFNVDNGNPWGGPSANCRHTALTVWLMDVGVRVSHSRPRHPQTNGKNERFHRTLKLEVIKDRHIHDVNHAQELFDKWREIYNNERPHEALDYAVPIVRYKPSYRSYKEAIEPFEYSADYTIYKVDNRGAISLEGRRIFVGVPFSGRYIGLREGQLDKGAPSLLVFYRAYNLGKFSLQHIPKSSCHNIYSSID